MKGLFSFLVFVLVSIPYAQEPLTSSEPPAFLDSINVLSKKVEEAKKDVSEAQKLMIGSLTRKGEKLKLQIVVKAKADFALASAEYHDFCAKHSEDPNEITAQKIYAWTARQAYQKAMTMYYSLLQEEKSVIDHARLKLDLQG